MSGSNDSRLRASLASRSGLTSSATMVPATSGHGACGMPLTGEFLASCPPELGPSRIMGARKARMLLPAGEWAGIQRALGHRRVPWDSERRLGLERVRVAATVPRFACPTALSPGSSCGALDVTLSRLALEVPAVHPRRQGHKAEQCWDWVGVTGGASPGASNSGAGLSSGMTARVGGWPFHDT